MQPSIVPAQHPASVSQPEIESLLQHLAHELRQPLSGIESVAFYLDMVVSAARPDLIPHCRRLRSMVQHANWLLDDASLSLRLEAQPLAPLALQPVFASIGERLFAAEDAILDVHGCAGLPPVFAPPLLPRVLEHVIAFFRDVAACPDPIHVRLDCEAHFLRAVIESPAAEDAPGLARLLDPPPPGSFPRRFFQSIGGGMCVGATSSSLAVTLLFPLDSQQPA